MWAPSPLKLALPEGTEWALSPICLELQHWDHSLATKGGIDNQWYDNAQTQALKFHNQCLKWTSARRTARLIWVHDKAVPFCAGILTSQYQYNNNKYSKKRSNYMVLLKVYACIYPFKDKTSSLISAANATSNAVHKWLLTTCGLWALGCLPLDFVKFLNSR